MSRPDGMFRLEAAGSLTPELDGVPSSRKHDRSGKNRERERPGKEAHKDGNH